MRKTLPALVLALALPSAYGADEKLSPKEDVEQIGERDVGSGVNFYSIEKEIALGRELAEQVERESRMVADPMISEYVNRIGQNLVRNSDAEVPFTFKVVDNPEINAFALPGGFCFVNTGLLLEAETEAEVAGVLAHEIAHVAARHGTRQASRSELANLATIPLTVLTGGWAGYGIRQAASFAIPMAFLQFSRGFEREADFLGLQYLYATGYDPTAFVDFFEKLAVQQKTKPGSFAGVFSSHPMTDDRIEDAQREMEQILPSRPEYVVNTSEFDKVKARLAAQLVARERGETEEQRPTVRRRTGVILPPEPEPSGGAEDEEAGPPVLRRSDDESSDEEDAGPPVMRRDE